MELLSAQLAFPIFGHVFSQWQWHQDSSGECGVSLNLVRAGWLVKRLCASFIVLACVVCSCVTHLFVLVPDQQHLKGCCPSFFVFRVSR